MTQSIIVLALAIILMIANLFGAYLTVARRTQTKQRAAPQSSGGNLGESFFSSTTELSRKSLLDKKRRRSR